MKTFFIIALCFGCTSVSAQIGTYRECHSFDSNLNRIEIDTSSIWRIGKPNKPNFTDSYEGVNSIVTHLDSNYTNNDTSVFIVEFPVVRPWGYFLPFEVAFMHRFDSDGLNDYGKVEVSYDTGVTWLDMTSDTLSDPNWNYHVNQITNDTVYGGLAISGNSNGWGYSRFKKAVVNALLGLDYNFYVRFTWVTDSMGASEGWQIDNLCFTMDYITSVNDLHALNNGVSVYPNPTTSLIHFDLDAKQFNEPVVMRMFDVTGRMVLTQTLSVNENTINVSHLKPGIYSYRLNETYGSFVVE